jgi:RNA polymerase sigma-70 factor (ECF subfamily)
MLRALDGSAESRPLIDADAVLLRRYRAVGDRSAFETLFRKYQGPVYGFVVRLVGREEAYDLTQEVFLRALRSLNTFRGDCTFRTWLYTIARHVCYNHCRDEKRRHAVEGLFGDAPVDGDEDGGESALDRVADTGPDVSRIAEMQELQRVVGEILDSMTVEQRLMITLRDFEDMSYEEIGQITELSLANVKSKLHRARLLFKTRFQPYWDALQEDLASSDGPIPGKSNERRCQ